MQSHPTGNTVSASTEEQVELASLILRGLDEVALTNTYGPYWRLCLGLRFDSDTLG
jgi:hypothetical protein